MHTKLICDYADPLIKANAGLSEIQKKMNQNRFEEARLLAHSVKIDIMFLQDAIEYQILKSSKKP